MLKRYLEPHELMSTFHYVDISLIGCMDVMGKKEAVDLSEVEDFLLEDDSR